MTDESRKVIVDILEYSNIEIDESQLEQQLEAALAEKMDDLDSLRDDLQHIGSVDHLGDVILNAVWDQFATQVAITAGEDFLRENGGLTLDLSDDAHIQSTEMFAEGIFATHYQIASNYHHTKMEKRSERNDLWGR